MAQLGTFQQASTSICLTALLARPPQALQPAAVQVQAQVPVQAPAQVRAPAHLQVPVRVQVQVVHLLAAARSRCKPCPDSPFRRRYDVSILEECNAMQMQSTSGIR